MDLNQKIIAGILAGFFLIALLRVFSTPLQGNEEKAGQNAGDDFLIQVHADSPSI